MPKKKGKRKIHIPTYVGTIILLILLSAIVAFILIPSEILKKPEKKIEIKKEEIIRKPTERDLLSEQDIERDIDMEVIETALQMYFAEVNHYPDSLQDLKPDYLDEIPKVAGTEEEYIYVVSKDKQNFELNVKLGKGGEELMKNDGGNDDEMYEVGTDLNLR